MLLFLLSLAVARASVVSVVITFRHGGRSPAYSFSWDTGFWDQGLGELSPEGMRQHYLNGRQFREKYIIINQIISPNYNEEQVFVRSSDYNRTLMSAEALLAGLFGNGPAIKSQQLANLAVPPFRVSNLANEQSKLGLYAIPNRFQTIPIHTVNLQYEVLLRGYSPQTCPRMAEINADMQNTLYYQNVIYQFENGLQKEIIDVFGVNASYSEAGWMGDTITAEIFHGFPMPEGVSNEMYNSMSAAYNISSSFVFNDEGSRLTGSLFFQAILDQFNSTINKSSQIRLGLYSAHDTSLAGFLSFMNLFDGNNPVFASTLIFELHEVDSDYFVQIIYNDQILTLQGCSQMCPYISFDAIIGSKIYPNINEACKLQSI